MRSLLQVLAAQAASHRVIFALVFTAAITIPSSSAVFDMPLAGVGAILAGAGSLFSGFAALRLAQAQVREKEREADRAEEDERWSHMNGEE